MRGSHHIFTKEGVEEILNLRPRGRDAKPYQVKQVRGVIVRHGLAEATMAKPKTESRYELIIYWSNEDRSFIVEVPELPGCAADGQTYKEAVANAERIIREWVETAKKLGRPIPQPKGRLMYA